MNNKPLPGVIFFLMLLAAITAFSCAPKRQPIERNHYLLETFREQPAHKGIIPAALTVRDFSVSPGYQGREIVYKTGNNIARADFYNLYFVLPGPMIAQLTRSWIKDSGLFDSVIPMSSHMDADYLLEGTIVSIYGDLRDPANPGAVMEINFLLLKSTDFEYEIVFQNKYKSHTRMEGTGTGLLIEGLNKSLEDILASLEEDLAEVLKVNGK